MGLFSWHGSPQLVRIHIGWKNLVAKGIQSGKFSVQRGIKSKGRNGKWVIFGPLKNSRHKIEEEQPETYTDMKGQTCETWWFEISKGSLWDNVKLLTEHLRGRDGVKRRGNLTERHIKDAWCV